jgi:Phage integrase family
LAASTARLTVSENAVQLGTRHAVGPTKGRQARSVPVPQFVLDELSVQCKGKPSGDVLFPGRDGGHLQRPKSSTGWFQAAVKKAKVQKITPHDLRHTCASLAVSAGVNVLALQRMLGHKSAKVTLDTYADLFDDDLDAVAVSLHARYSTAHNCDSPKLLASWGQNPATGRSQGVASKSKNDCLPAEMPPPHQCGRRDSNPIRLPGQSPEISSTSENTSQ